MAKTKKRVLIGLFALLMCACLGLGFAGLGGFSARAEEPGTAGPVAAIVKQEGPEAELFESLQDAFDYDAETVGEEGTEIPYTVYLLGDVDLGNDIVALNGKITNFILSSGTYDETEGITPSETPFTLKGEIVVGGGYALTLGNVKVDGDIYLTTLVDDDTDTLTHGTIAASQDIPADASYAIRMSALDGECWWIAAEGEEAVTLVTGTDETTAAQFTLAESEDGVYTAENLALAFELASDEEGNLSAQWIDYTVEFYNKQVKSAEETDSILMSVEAVAGKTYRWGDFDTIEAPEVPAIAFDESIAEDDALRTGYEYVFIGYALTIDAQAATMKFEAVYQVVAKNAYAIIVFLDGVPMGNLAVYPLVDGATFTMNADKDGNPVIDETRGGRNGHSALAFYAGENKIEGEQTFNEELRKKLGTPFATVSVAADAAWPLESEPFFPPQQIESATYTLGLYYVEAKYEAVEGSEHTFELPSASVLDSSGRPARVCTVCGYTETFADYFADTDDEALKADIAEFNRIYDDYSAKFDKFAVMTYVRVFLQEKAQIEKEIALLTEQLEALEAASAGGLAALEEAPSKEELEAEKAELETQLETVNAVLALDCYKEYKDKTLEEVNAEFQNAALELKTSIVAVQEGLNEHSTDYLGGLLKNELSAALEEKREESASDLIGNEELAALEAQIAVIARRYVSENEDAALDALFGEDADAALNVKRAIAKTELREKYAARVGAPSDRLDTVYNEYLQAVEDAESGTTLSALREGAKAAEAEADWAEFLDEVDAKLAEVNEYLDTLESEEVKEKAKAAAKAVADAWLQKSEGEQIAPEDPEAELAAIEKAAVEQAMNDTQFTARKEAIAEQIAQTRRDITEMNDILPVEQKNAIRTALDNVLQTLEASLADASAFEEIEAAYDAAEIRLGEVVVYTWQSGARGDINNEYTGAKAMLERLLTLDIFGEDETVKAEIAQLLEKIGELRDDALAALGEIAFDSENPSGKDELVEEIKELLNTYVGVEKETVKSETTMIGMLETFMEENAETFLENYAAALIAKHESESVLTEDEFAAYKTAVEKALAAAKKVISDSFVGAKGARVEQTWRHTYSRMNSGLAALDAAAAQAVAPVYGAALEEVYDAAVAGIEALGFTDGKAKQGYLDELEAVFEQAKADLETAADLAEVESICGAAAEEFELIVGRAEQELADAIAAAIEKVEGYCDSMSAQVKYPEEDSELLGRMETYKAEAAEELGAAETFAAVAKLEREALDAYAYFGQEAIYRNDLRKFAAQATSGIESLKYLKNKDLWTVAVDLRLRSGIEAVTSLTEENKTEAGEAVAKATEEITELWLGAIEEDLAEAKKQLSAEISDCAEAVVAEIGELNLVEDESADLTDRAEAVAEEAVGMLADAADVAGAEEIRDGALEALAELLLEAKKADAVNTAKDAVDGAKEAVDGSTLPEEKKQELDGALDDALEALKAAVEAAENEEEVEEAAKLADAAIAAAEEALAELEENKSTGTETLEGLVAAAKAELTAEKLPNLTEEEIEGYIAEIDAAAADAKAEIEAASGFGEITDVLEAAEAEFSAIVEKAQAAQEAAKALADRKIAALTELAEAADAAEAVVGGYELTEEQVATLMQEIATAEETAEDAIADAESIEDVDAALETAKGVFGGIGAKAEAYVAANDELARAKTEALETLATLTEEIKAEVGGQYEAEEIAKETYDAALALIESTHAEAERKIEAAKTVEEVEAALENIYENVRVLVRKETGKNLLDELLEKALAVLAEIDPEDDGTALYFTYNTYVTRIATAQSLRELEIMLESAEGEMACALGDAAMPIILSAYNEYNARLAELTSLTAQQSSQMSAKLQRAEATSLTALNRAGIDEIVETAENGVLSIAKVYYEAYLRDVAEGAKKFIESYDMLDGTELAAHKADIDRTADFAVEYVNGATTVSEAEERAKTAAQSIIDARAKAALRNEKNTAKAELDAFAEKTIGEIGELGLGESVVAAAREKIGEAVAAAKEKIDAQFGSAAVQRELENGKKAIEAVKDMNLFLLAQNTAKAEFAEKTEAAKAEIDALPDLTAEEKTKAKAEIDALLTETNGKIDAATDAGSLEAAVSEAEGTLGGIVSGAHTLSDGRLTAAAEKAKQELREAADAAKAKIDALADLDGQKATEFKNAIDEAVNSALAQIEKAKSVEEVETAVETATGSIEGYTASAQQANAEALGAYVETKAAELAEARKNAEAEIDKLTSLTYEERTEYKTQIGTECEKFEARVKAAETRAAVDGVMQEAKEYLDGVVALAKLDNTKPGVIADLEAKADKAKADINALEIVQEDKDAAIGQVETALAAAKSAIEEATTQQAIDTAVSTAEAAFERAISDAKDVETAKKNALAEIDEFIGAGGDFEKALGELETNFGLLDPDGDAADEKTAKLAELRARAKTLADNAKTAIGSAAGNAAVQSALSGFRSELTALTTEVTETSTAFTGVYNVSLKASAVGNEFIIEGFAEWLRNAILSALREMLEAMGRNPGGIVTTFTATCTTEARTRVNTILDADAQTARSKITAYGAFEGSDDYLAEDGSLAYVLTEAKASINAADLDGIVSAVKEGKLGLNREVAKANIDAEADKLNKEIDAMGVSDAATRKAAVASAARMAKTRIENAADDDEITERLNGGLGEIGEARTQARAKAIEEANAAIDEAALNALAEDLNLTEGQRTAAQTKVNEARDAEKAKFEAALDENGLPAAVEAAKSAITAAAAPAKELSDARTSAKTELDSAVSAAKEAVSEQKLPMITEEQRTAATTAIDNANTTATGAFDADDATAASVNEALATAKSAIGAAQKAAEAQQAAAEELAAAKAAAKKAVTDKAAEANAEINGLTDLADKEAAAKKVNDAAEAAQAEIDAATSVEDVNQARDEGIGAVDSALAEAKLQNAKDKAKNDLNNEADKAKSDIDGLGDLTDEQKSEAKGKVDAAVTEANGKIDAAEDQDAVDGALAEGKQKVNDEVDAAVARNAAAGLQKAKDAAKGEIDAEADRAKGEVDKLDKLTDAEKQAAKDEIDKAAEAAKGKVDAAEDQAGIDSAVAEGKSGIKAAEDSAKEKQANAESGDKAKELADAKAAAKAEIDEYAAAAKQAVDAREDLNDEQKAEAKEAIDNAAAAAKSNIDKATDTAGVNKAKEDGKSAIDNAKNADYGGEITPPEEEKGDLVWLIVVLAIILALEVVSAVVIIVLNRRKE